MLHETHSNKNVFEKSVCLLLASPVGLTPVLPEQVLLSQMSFDSFQMEVFAPTLGPTDL